MKVSSLILILSLLGNGIALFVLYKAIDYRRKMISAWSQSESWVKEYNKENTGSQRINERPDLVLLGASITSDWDLKQYFPDKTILNRGIDGQFSGQLMLRFKRDVLDPRPEAVVIKLCEMNFGHDIPIQVTKDNMEMMLMLSRAADLPVYLISVIPVSKTFDRAKEDRELNVQIGEFNEWLKQLAEKTGNTFIDIASPLSDETGSLRDGYTTDGVHLNQKGYDLMSQVVGDRIFTKED